VKLRRDICTAEYSHKQVLGVTKYRKYM